MAAPDNSVLIERIKNGDTGAKARMIEENLRLVEKIALRFRDRGYDREEIVQVGVIGLIKAIDKFNSDYNTQFSTYAYPVIEGEIKRFLRDDGSIKVSRSLKEIAAAGKRAEENLRRKLGREPLMSEISAECNIAADELTEAFSAAAPMRSIYESVYDSGSGEIILGDTIADKPEEDRIINKVMVSQILAALNPRDRRIIEMRYFEDRPQREIAEEIGVSQVQVSRLEKKILTRLRGIMV